jgi:hypothetical protein
VTSADSTTALVYVQVVDPSGGVVQQQAFDNQSFTAGQQRTFPVTWNVPSGMTTGAYTVKVGVFSPGWGVMHTWNDQAASFNVTSGVVPPTATPVPPTATPAPTGACSPRPPVTTNIVKEFSGVLRVTVSATGANNTIRRIAYDPSNAIVRVAGLPDQTSQFTTTPQTVSTTFRVYQRTRGAARVNLAVTDACGTWQTFVGGGNGAF